MTLLHVPAGTRRRTHLIALAAGPLLAAPLVLTPAGTASAAPAGHAPAAAPAAAPPAAASISWARRVSGLDQPVQVTSAREGLNRLFVVEKPGRIRIVKDGKVRAKSYLNITSRVSDAGEGGLLSVAFHPHFAKHPFLWVAYTNNAGDVQVSRFRAKGPHSTKARRGTEKHVITVPHPAQFTNHFGGQLMFGPGNELFMSTGDGGGSGDPFNHGQSKKTLQGKILRMHVIGAKKDCGKYMCVPSGNPYAGKKKGRGAIWLTGLRNAWRFSVDPATGDLWIGDVGQDAVEEVDHVTHGGLNLGWSCREGNTVYNASRCKSGRSYFAPVYTYTHSYGRAIIGGFIYRGSRFASVLAGRYVGGDEVSGKIFYSSGGGLVTAGQLDGVASFGEDDSHELWAVTFNGGLFQMSAT
jgi:glucose/arabinose dehydrogenase